jgi:hypothetical protein
MSPTNPEAFWFWRSWRHGTKTENREKRRSFSAEKKVFGVASKRSGVQFKARGDAGI